MQDFIWEAASTPLSSFYVPLYTSIAYILVVVAVHFSKPLRWKPLLSESTIQSVVMIHNIVLLLSSAFMFFSALTAVIDRSKLEGVGWLTCESPTTLPRGALWRATYIYYLSKYYELLDTFLQVREMREKSMSAAISDD